MKIFHLQIITLKEKCCLYNWCNNLYIVIKMKTHILKSQRTLDFLSPDLGSQSNVALRNILNILALENVHHPRVIHFSLF